VDGDGRLDYVCADQWEPSFFFKNESPHAGAFLGLRLVLGKGSPAIGALATVNWRTVGKWFRKSMAAAGIRGGAVLIFTLD